MNRVIAVVIVVLLVIATGIFITSKGIGGLSMKPSPTDTVPSNSTSTTPSQNDLLQGGSSYLDKKGVYSILYPNEYKVDWVGDDEYTRIYKIGGTQQGQTEIYDGIILHFQSVDLGGSKLEDWVESQIKKSTADGTSEVTEPMTNIVFNSYPGFSYSIRGLGETKNFVLQKDSETNFAVSINILIADPQNEGYQKEVDDILSTLKILK